MSPVTEKANKLIASLDSTDLEFGPSLQEVLAETLALIAVLGGESVDQTASAQAEEQISLSLASEVRELRRQLQDAETTIEDLERLKEELTERVSDVESRLDRHDGRIVDLKRQQKTLVRSLETSLGVHAKLSQRLDQIEPRVADHQDRIHGEDPQDEQSLLSRVHSLETSEAVTDQLLKELTSQDPEIPSGPPEVATEAMMTANLALGIAQDLISRLPRVSVDLKQEGEAFATPELNWSQFPSWLRKGLDREDS